jgi:pantoate--beta-alanine ligase
MAHALIAIGSNAGDRQSALRDAVQRLGEVSGVSVLSVSRWHETEPVGGPPDQSPFLNGAALVETSLDPFALFAALQHIEIEMGRVQRAHWGPRVIDLDLLLYDELRLQSPALTIPHPRMSGRWFVLTPAAEIAGEMKDPVSGFRVSELLAQLGQRPLVIATVDEMQRLARAARREGKKIGLVPTMGALHAGHLSLIDAANRECVWTVATIFVNPTQFGPHEDYARYPRQLDGDLKLLSGRGVDVVFAPSAEEMYPVGYATAVTVEGITRRWEGAIRPGHFSGVATVVLKLFHATLPHAAFFGQKDYQQCAVIRRMTVDLDVPVEIRVCPIVRDADGLALSSRNVYLSSDERRRALSLSKSLARAAELWASGTRRSETITAAMRAILESAPVEVDYAAVVDGDTLAPIDEAGPGSVALVAARLGATRLIDNHIFR